MKYHLPFIFWLIVIFVESSLPREDYPEVNIFGAAKIVHVGIYFLLGLLCFISLIHQNKFRLFYNKPYLWTIIICFIYSISDELHQGLVPGRTYDTIDIVIDTFGAILAVIVIKYYLAKRLKIFNVNS